MKKLISKLIIGFIIGLFVAFLLIFHFFPKMMFHVNESKYNFEETYSKLEDSILEHEWDIQRIYDIQGCMKQYGYDDVKKLKIFSFCKPDNVESILSNSEDKHISAMMPCRISIFETENGNVYISRMNIGLMGKLFGGNIGKVMSEVAKDERSIVQEVIKQ